MSAIPAPATRPLRVWFLFLLLVVFLPLLAAFGFLKQMVQEHHNVRRENLQNDLERMAGSFPTSFTPESILETLHIRILKEKPQLRERFFRHFAAKNPGALQIALWDKSGRLLPVPPGMAFPADLPLIQVIALLQHGPEALTEYRSLMERSGEDKELRSFQAFLGSSLSLADFFRHSRNVIQFQRQEKLTFAYWFEPEESPIGYLGMFDWSKMAPDYLMKLAIRLNFTKTNASLAFLDQTNHRNSCLSKDLPQTLGFVRRLNRAAKTRQGQTFFVDRHLAAEIAADLGPGKKLFLLLDFSAIWAENDRLLTRLHLGVGLFIGMVTLILGLLRRGWGRNLSIAWRIAVLLLIAIVIPLLGAFWAGTSVIRELEKQDHQNLYQKLRLKATILPSRQESFLTGYGVALRQRLTRITETQAPESVILKKLQALTEYRKGQARKKPRHPGDFGHVAIPGRQARKKPRHPGDFGHVAIPGRQYLNAGPITDFFLSDDKGNIKHHSSKRNQEMLPFLKILVRRLFRENIEAGESSSGILGEAALEEFGAKGVKNDKQSNPWLPMNTISTSRFSSGELTFLPLLVTLENQKRILLARFSRELLEHYFIRQELLQGFPQRLQHIDEDGIQRFFHAFRTTLKNFSEVSDAPILAAQELDVRFYSHWPQDIFGTFTWNQEQYVFYVAPCTLLAGNRFLAVASITEISAKSARRARLFRWWCLFVLATAFLLGSILTRRILAPLARLDSALGKIRAGDLSVRLPPLGDDEIGRVGHNVNLMVGELREKERLQAYLSETTLQAIKDGSVDHNLEAQHREVTIFFSDIRGFTTLSEQHAPEELFSVLNEFYEAADSFLRESGGQVQKFIGDAIYAVFPTPGRQGAQGAITAAMQIMSFLAEFNRQRRETGQFTIAIGIGINTGEVLLGKVGSDERKDFAYIGEAVNTAATLETASKHGTYTRILISPNTYVLLSPWLKVAEPPLPEDLKRQLPERVFEICEFFPPADDRQ
jgi:adenylate cyclase